MRELKAAAQRLHHVGDCGDHVIGENQPLEVRQIARQRVANFRQPVVVHQERFESAEVVNRTVLVSGWDELIIR